MFAFLQLMLLEAGPHHSPWDHMVTVSRVVCNEKMPEDLENSGMWNLSLLHNYLLLFAFFQSLSVPCLSDPTNTMTAFIQRTIRMNLGGIQN
jgi:hypothetical protein